MPGEGRQKSAAKFPQAASPNVTRHPAMTVIRSRDICDTYLNVSPYNGSGRKDRNRFINQFIYQICAAK
jgi:hypothetical protein